MVRFHLTDELREIIETSGLDGATIRNLLSKDHILHQDLISFYQLCHPTKTFIDLTNKTKLYIPNKSQKEPVKKSDEFIKSMEQLRLKQKEEEYQTLVRPKDEFKSMYEQAEEMSPSQMNKELRSQVTTIFNILLSVVSVAYAIWYWTSTSWSLPNGYRILMCLFFGILVLVAEVTVYSGYLRRVEEAKTNERKKKEVKKVIKSYKFTKLD